MKKRLMRRSERLINGLLSRDPEIAARLKEHEGKLLVFDVQGLALCFACLIKGNSISILGEQDIPDERDIVISGKPFSLIALALNSSSKSQVSLTGDLLLLQDLRRIFSDLDMNWADILSPYVGDFMAGSIGKFAIKTKEVFLGNRARFRNQLSNFLAEELEASPNKERVVDFYDSVSTLRDDVERLEVRINALT